MYIISCKPYCKIKKNVLRKQFRKASNKKIKYKRHL